MLFSPKSLAIRLTNVECKNFDKTFVDIKQCRLSVAGRNKIAFNIYVKLLQPPVDNIKINAQFLRKSFDFRPYLYNNTIDFCEFLRNKNKFLFWKIVYEIGKPYTNVNHTCPFDHDFILDNFVLNVDMMKLIPFPAGDYQIKFDVFLANEFKARLKMNFLIED